MTTHDDRPVTAVTFAGHRAIAKRYVDADSAGIYASMVDLWRSPFGAQRCPPGMPEPLEHTADGVIVMSEVIGDPVGSRGSLGLTIELGPACALLLAGLHRSGVVVPRRRDARGVLRSLERKTTRLDAINPAVRPMWRTALSEMADRAPHDEALVVCHGDFSPRNVLVGAQGVVLIDFDRLQMAGAARDVEYWRSWAWATQLLRCEQADWAITEPFADAYATAGCERGDAGFYRAAALLRIAEGWSALVPWPELQQRLVLEALVAISAP